MATPNLSKYARVIVPIPRDEPFIYEIPEELRDQATPGVQVVVPFGKTYLAGIILDLTNSTDQAEQDVKRLHDVVSPEPYLPSELMQVIEWISGYYICFLG